jgi:hypothetical protein
MRLQTILVAGLLAIAATGSAKADTFGFTYTQGNQDGIFLTISGTLSADTTATPGQYSITNVTGTEVFSIGGTPSSMDNITGLLSPDGVYQADNQLYTSGLTPYLDISGFTFTTDGNGADGYGDVNIAYFSQGVYTTPYETGPTPNGAFALTEVPEPASLSLCLGFLGLGFFVRKARSRI